MSPEQLRALFDAMPSEEQRAFLAWLRASIVDLEAGHPIPDQVSKCFDGTREEVVESMRAELAALEMKS